MGRKESNQTNKRSKIRLQRQTLKSCVHSVLVTMGIVFYAPNFGKVEEAYYCFGLVHVSVQNLLRYSFEISYMDSSSKNN